MLRKVKLCNRIKEYRLSCGLTQADLSSLLGISRNAVCSLERGDYCPSAYTALMLCDIFNCSFEDLFYFQERLF